MFTTPLEIRLIGDQHFMLINPLVYETEDYILTVLTGFDFDGASIPESLWHIIGCPFGGIYTKASCLHDALYSNHIFDRKQSDKILHDAMIASGVSRILAKEMYLAVRMFGEEQYVNGAIKNDFRDILKFESKGKE